MASSETRPIKQLRELLQEDQEDFNLEAYLVERGHSKSEPRKRLSNSIRTLKKGFLHPTKLLKSVYKKLALVNNCFKINNCNDKDGEVSVHEITTNTKEATKSDTLSSATTATVFNSCPQSDQEEASTSVPNQDHVLLVSDKKDEVTRFRVPYLIAPLHNHNPVLNLDEQAHSDTKLRRRGVKTSNKQKTYFQSKFPLSDLPFSLYSPTCSSQETPKKPFVPKVTEDSILSASFLELLVCSTAVGELRESSQLMKCKRILLQNKQLLFDCVREVIESRVNLGSQEIGKLTSEKVKEWGKQCANERNINEVVSLDYRESVEEWNDFKLQKMEIAMVIGDDILEELRNQLVVDMLHSLVLEMLNHLSI